MKRFKKGVFMGKTKPKDASQVVVLDYDSDYNGFVYEAGKEYTVDAETAKRLLEINKILRRENS
jgi:hypothetical protein